MWNPRGSPHRLPRRTKGSKQKSTSNPGSPHKQKYDQGGSPQAELRPGRLPTSRTETREPTWLAGWLAVGGITTREPVMRLGGWVAGWGAGWLAEAQRGSQRPREAQRGPGRPWVEQACRALGWRRRLCRGLLEAFFRELGPFKKRLPNISVADKTQKFAVVKSSWKRFVRNWCRLLVNG